MNNLPNVKKERIEAARKDGVCDWVNRAASAAYLLHSIAYLWERDYDDILKQYGLNAGYLKVLSSRMQKAQEQYFREFSEMVKDPKMTSAYFGDIDKYRTEIGKMIGLEDFKPKTPKNTTP